MPTINKFSRSTAVEPQHSPDRPETCARLHLTPGAVCAGDVHIGVADVAKAAPSVASKRLFRRHTGPQPVALVGFREWIFSENSGPREYGRRLTAWNSPLFCCDGQLLFFLPEPVKVQNRGRSIVT